MKKLIAAILSSFILSTTFASACTSKNFTGSYLSHFTFLDIPSTGNLDNMMFWIPIYNFDLVEVDEGSLKFILTGFTDQGEGLLSLGTTEEKNEAMAEFQLLEKEIMKVTEVDGKCAITSGTTAFYAKDDTHLFTLEEDEGEINYSQLMIKL